MNINVESFEDAVTQLRELNSPAAARQLELASELTDSKELSWGLVCCLALLAGKYNDEITVASGELEGLATTIEASSRKGVVQCSLANTGTVAVGSVSSATDFALRTDQSTRPCSASE